MKNIIKENKELLQAFDKLPGASRYDLKQSELSALMIASRVRPLEAVSVSWYRGFQAGLKYAQRQQKRTKSAR